MLQNTTILIAQPGERSENQLLRILNKKTGAVLHHAKNPTEALEVIQNHRSIQILVTDLFFPKKSGFNLITDGCGINPAMVPVLTMPFGRREHFFEAHQAGVFFHIFTPYDEPEMLEVIKNAVEYQKILAADLERAPRLRKSDGFKGIIGNSAPMQELFSIIQNVAANAHGNTLLRGESGTGKELVAQAIHRLTPERNRHNFVPVNCAAIPDELLESELFGYAKGAFTGAVRSKKGRLAHADKGTLFLDEIGDMKPNMQAKLLRVLQEQSFEPIGSVIPTAIDVRVIAATNRNLEQGIREGTFREDLFYRLSVIPITIPPLRERTEDIDALIEAFLLVYNRGRNTPIQGFTPQAMAQLKAHNWPGNIRELQNLVQRICILHGGDTVDVTALPKKFIGLQNGEGLETEATAGPAAERAVLTGCSGDTRQNPEGSDGKPGTIAGGAMDFHTMTYEYENRLILQALEAARGNKKEAARLLNMKRTTLLEKIKKRKLDQERAG